jgi:hypothetical protein
VRQRDRRWPVIALLAVVAAAGVLTLLALARGAEAETATGDVVSTSKVRTGTVVCVQDRDSDRTLCGEANDGPRQQLARRLNVGDCVYIKVARDAALELERRDCT